MARPGWRSFLPALPAAVLVMAVAAWWSRGLLQQQWIPHLFRWIMLVSLLALPVLTCPWVIRSSRATTSGKRKLSMVLVAGGIAVGSLVTNGVLESLYFWTDSGGRRFLFPPSLPPSLQTLVERYGDKHEAIFRDPEVFEEAALEDATFQVVSLTLVHFLTFALGLESLMVASSFLIYVPRSPRSHPPPPPPPPTSNLVFISYASEDQESAFAVCEALERTSIRCWIAPRDIPRGDPYAAAILNAIEGSRVFILLLSAAANRSQHLPREVEIALGRGLPIITLRIEDVEPSGSLQYYLAALQWMDAFPDLSDHFVMLIEEVQRRVSAKEPAKR
jgi:hypothetical protein